MADLLFKRGLYSNLHNVAVADGAVYFTTDTNEIYFDDAAGRHRIADTIVVSTYSELNSKYPLAADKAALAGRLVYITDNNILMTYNGTQWVQINAQKDLVGVLGSAQYILTGGNNAVNVTHKIGTDAEEDKNVSASFYVRTQTANTVTLGVNNGNLVIDVKETEEHANIAAEATTNGAKVTVANKRDTLKADGSVESTVERTSSNVEIVGEGVVAQVGLNDAGQIAVNADFDAKLSTENGVIKLTVAKGDEAVCASSQVVPKIKLANGTEDILFASANGALTATLPVYSTTEVDAKVKAVSDKVDNTADALRDEMAAKLASANAMTFKGTVGTGATVPSLPTVNVNIGDTYKVLTSGAYYTNTNPDSEVEATVGDLFIATSTTGKESGVQADTDVPVILASEVEWVHVPAGDDANPELYVYNGVINLGADARDNKNGTISAGAGLAIDGDAQDATIRHADVAHTVAAQTAVKSDATTAHTFTAVSGVTVNEQGHVTEVQTTEVTLTNFAPTVEQRIAGTATQINILSNQKYVTYENDGTASETSVSPINLSVATDSLVLEAGTDNKTFKINHPVLNPVATNGGNVGSLADLQIVSAVATNADGHVTGVTTVGLTHEAIAPVSNAVVTTVSNSNNVYNTVIENTLTYGEGDSAITRAGRYGFESKTLTMAQVSANKVSVDLTWGSF